MMNVTQNTNLTRLDQARYSSAELGVSAIESFIRLYLMIYLTDRIGLPPTMAGYAVAIGVLWDGFADPILGYLSDRTRSRWGRRLPWMIVGAPLLALSFIQLFALDNVEATSTWTAFWQVTLFNILLNTAMTMVSIPHLALGQDIASGKDERTSLYAWRTLMTLLGLLTGILTPVIFIALGYQSSTNQHAMAVAISIICLLSATVTIGAVWRRQVGQFEISYEEKSILTPRNLGTPIKILMGAFFVATLGQGLNSTWALYYYQYRLRLTEQSLGLVLIVFVVSLCATLPLWVYLSRRFSKARLIATGTLALGIFTALAYPNLPASELTGPMILAVLGGIFLGSTGLLESMLVDVAEVSNIRESSMGQVFGIWKFVAKTARAAAIALGGYFLELIGYTPMVTAVEPDVAHRIGILFGPVVAAFFIIAGGMILFVGEDSPTVIEQDRI